MKLLIISHVLHYQYQGKLYAYTPYTREIDQWARLFPEVVIASPLVEQEPPADCCQFQSNNVQVQPIFLNGSTGTVKKIGVLFQLPKVVQQLVAAIRSADAVHVRCPGNLGLLGAVLAPLFRKCVIAKYAGQWTNYPGEAYSYRFQKKLLSSKWFHGPVLVYGTFPDQPAHVHSFFTSVMTEEQMDQARSATQQISFHKPSRILFVGRLSKAKNVDTLLQSLAKLKHHGLDFACDILGNGPEFDNLVSLSKSLSLKDQVVFRGGVDFDEVMNFYHKSDVLVLVSETEGWPKVIAEAMAYGLICVGSNRGFVSSMLAGRGLVVAPGNAEELASALVQIIQEPSNFLEMRKQAACWAQQFTLDGLDSLKRIMEKDWAVTLQNVDEI